MNVFIFSIASRKVDVYKRQQGNGSAPSHPPALSETNPRPFFPRPSPPAGGQSMECQGAVSYTHLDVYKRQMLYISAARASWETTAAVIFLCAICSSYSTRLISATMSFTACLDAVSYTHLVHRQEIAVFLCQFPELNHGFLPLPPPANSSWPPPVSPPRPRRFSGSPCRSFPP